MKSAERLFFVSVLGAAAVLGLVWGQKGYTICDVQGCNCTLIGGWKNVNCNLLDDQTLTLQPGHIPQEVTEIFLNGGESITFASRTFKEDEAFAVLRLERVKKVTFQRKAFLNIKSSSLLVQILGCDEVVFQTLAFGDMQGSLSTEIVGTKNVKLEASPFSKLSNATFQDIEKLTLESGAFEIKNLGSIGRHGPVTVLLFANVMIPEIPKDVFLTSLAQIAFRDSRIGDIKFEAFRSAEISAVQIINTTVGTIKSGALTDRTLVVDLKISKCLIKKLESKAITAGMGNLTVSHSTITDIEPKAIAVTAAKVEFIGNQILNLKPTGLHIQNWNRIAMDQNIIKNLHGDFILAPMSANVERFSFKGNEIYNSMDGSLSFLGKLDDTKVVFDDNFFNQSCSCELSEWIEKVTNNTFYSDAIMQTSFCVVDDMVSRCFSLPVEIINMQNFTERSCTNNTIICEPYNGETRTINITGKMFVDYDQNEKQNWLIFIVAIIGFFIIALVSTFVVLLVRGSRWLKRKGYFRNQYYNNNHSIEEENTIVTMDAENEKLEIPEELTIDFLHELSKRLDDPATHQDASEMIERLYEMFIVDDSYENNNREEEAHLYEELGNLNLQIPPPPYEEQPAALPSTTAGTQTQSTGPRGILKLMEEKFTTNVNCPLADNHKTNLDSSTPSKAPILSGDYSEPIDKDVHLYSELRQKDETKDSVGSGNMALRPLPDKPAYLFQAGPSTKL